MLLQGVKGTLWLFLFGLWGWMTAESDGRMQGCLCVCFWFIFHQVLCDTQKESVWTQLAFEEMGSTAVTRPDGSGV